MVTTPAAPHAVLFDIGNTILEERRFDLEIGIAAVVDRELIEITGDRVIQTVDPVLGGSGDGVWIAPGFIDLQVNGFGGVDFGHDVGVDCLCLDACNVGRWCAKGAQHRIELFHPPQNCFGDFGRRELFGADFIGERHRLHTADLV